MSGHFIRRAFAHGDSPMMCLVLSPRASAYPQILTLCITPVRLISSSPFKSVQLLSSKCLVTVCSAGLSATYREYGEEWGAVLVLKADAANSQYLPGVVVARGGWGACSLGGPRIPVVVMSRLGFWKDEWAIDWWK